MARTKATNQELNLPTTSNVSGSIQVGSIIFQWGWGYITTTSGVNLVQNSITFPIPYSAIYTVQAQNAGQKTGSNPTSPTDTNQYYRDGVVEIGTLTNTGCQVTVRTNSGGTFGNAERWLYTWFAVGAA